MLRREGLGAILVARRNRHDLEFGIVSCRIDHRLGRNLRRPENSDAYGFHGRFQMPRGHDTHCGP